MRRSLRTQLDREDYAADDYISLSDFLTTVLMVSLVALPLMWQRPPAATGVAASSKSAVADASARAVRIERDGLSAGGQRLDASDLHKMTGAVVLRLAPDVTSSRAAAVYALFPADADIKVQLESEENK